MFQDIRVKEGGTREVYVPNRDDHGHTGYTYDLRDRRSTVNDSTTIGK
jgi:hypothetical protein